MGGKFTSNTLEQFGACLDTDAARRQKIRRQIGLTLD